MLAGSIVGCGSYHDSGASLPANGPLRVDPKQGWAVRAVPGKIFTDGTLVLDSTNGAPMTIVSVQSVGGGQTLKLLGAKVASPERAYTTTTRFSRWPPRAVHAMRITDAVGQTITTASINWHKQPFELLLGYKVMSSEYGVRSAVRVVYTSGGNAYQALLPSLLAACPPHQDLGTCGDRAFDSN